MYPQVSMKQLQQKANGVVASQGVNVTLSSGCKVNLELGKSAKIKVQIENLSERDLELNPVFVITLSRGGGDQVERRRNVFGVPSGSWIM
jgi:hypothetical protein